MKLSVLSILLATTAAPAWACDFTGTSIVFPGQGTHKSWYCKATPSEKRAALEAGRRSACVSAKLDAWGHHPISPECTDIIPYYLTKEDALKAGPVLDCRVVLSSSSEDGIERKIGYQWAAVAQTPHAAFELSEPLLYFRDCPATGCTERYQELCPAQPQTSLY